MNSTTNPVLVNKYYTLEKIFFNDLSSSLKGDLIFYCVTGSLARGDIIPGWSDIDLLLVLKKYNKKTFIAISNALSQNKTNIKIGLTFYVYEEFVSSFFKDPKTLHTIELIKRDIYKPKIFDRHIEKIINKNNYHDLSLWYDVVSFSRILHRYKRSLLPANNYDEKKTFKLLGTLLKIILRQLDIPAFGYKEIFKLSRKNLKDFNINFKQPEYIIRHPDTSLSRYANYIKFLDWLKNYPYAKSQYKTK